MKNGFVIVAALALLGAAAAQPYSHFKAVSVKHVAAGARARHAIFIKHESRAIGAQNQFS